MLDLQQLRYFVAVAEEEHVGRAAARLALSPSPLSRQVRQLEARLGAALFDRTEHRLRLTADGRAFLDDARAVLALADTVEARARDAAAGRAGTLRIGYVEGALHATELPTALRRFTEDWPDVRLELSLLRTEAQHEALAHGSLDMSFGYAAMPERADVVSELVVDEPFVLALPSGHPLRSGRLSPGALAGAPFIGPPRTHRAAHDRVVALCAAAGFKPDLRFEVAAPTAVLTLVAAGLGVAIVQESLATTGTPGVTFRPLPASSERVRIYASYRPAGGLAARRLAELLRTPGVDRRTGQESRSGGLEPGLR